jgi:hypothetical protein
MTKIGVITIYGRTASANKLDAMGFRDRLKYKKRWRSDAGMAALMEKIAKAKEKRRLVITGYRKKLCDRQNFARGIKPCLDGLVDAGVLVDDAEKWLEDEYRQVCIAGPGGAVIGNEERIIIEVWE